MIKEQDVAGHCPTLHMRRATMDGTGNAARPPCAVAPGNSGHVLPWFQQLHGAWVP
jgi:hypothetical protein